MKLVYPSLESAMSSISTFHPYKLNIVLVRYYVDGGRTGRGECNKDDATIHSNRAQSEGIITIAGNADGSTHAM